jgi:ketosteroid isomerase-like protein
MRLVTHLALLGVAGLALATLGAAPDSRAADEKAVADLDTQYQAAVEKNDADTMARILLDDFVLVVGNGTVYNKADLIKSAKDKDFVWEHQVEDPGTQKVRVHGDTAVVTARLWLKGTSGGKPIDKKLWFSDTYVRTPPGLALLLRPGLAQPAALSVNATLFTPSEAPPPDRPASRGEPERGRRTQRPRPGAQARWRTSRGRTDSPRTAGW